MGQEPFWLLLGLFSKSDPPSGRNPKRPLPQEWICTRSNCVDCQAVFAGKPAPTFGSWGAREIGAGRQGVTGASSLATGPASHQRYVDTYAAIAACQSPSYQLTHRYRRQASSHILTKYGLGSVVEGFDGLGRQPEAAQAALHALEVVDQARATGHGHAHRQHVDHHQVGNA